jgi:hypothetical protein
LAPVPAEGIAELLLPSLLSLRLMSVRPTTIPTFFYRYR